MSKSLKQISREAILLEAQIMDQEGEIDALLEEKMTINSLEQRDKIDGLVYFMDHIDSRLKYFEDIKSQAKDAQKLSQKIIERLKKYILHNMDMLQTNELKGDSFRLTSVDTTSVHIINKEDIPLEYHRTVQTTEIDKEKLLKDLKQGFQIPGCALMHSRHARKYMVTK